MLMNTLNQTKTAVFTPMLHFVIPGDHTTRLYFSFLNRYFYYNNFWNRDEETIPTNGHKKEFGFILKKMSPS